MKRKFKRIVAFAAAVMMCAEALFCCPAASMAEDDTVANSTSAADIADPVISTSIMDCIYFGSYWQEDTNGDGTADENDDKTPIRWRILKMDGNKAFLLSEDVLDWRQFSSDSENNTWEDSTIRSWLNSEFYDAAFDDEQKNAIYETTLKNTGYGQYDTLDKVFLLSDEEAGDPAYGFANISIQVSRTRQAAPTDYAGEKGAETNTDGWTGWWLRTRDYYGWSESPMVSSHEPWTRCKPADAIYGVRPALYMDLSAYVCETAGETEIGTVSEWDTVYFGNYWQEDTNDDGNADKLDKKTPIKWRVLSVDENEAYLMADKLLDYMPGTDLQFESWESSDAREWLNGEFMANAFSKKEQQALIETGETKDKVSLLSKEDVTDTQYGFPGHSVSTYARSAKDSDYAAGRYKIGFQSSWMLRTYQAFIYTDGSIIVNFMSNVNCAIRPVIRVDTSFYRLIKAGTVKATDYLEKETESKPTPIVTQAPTSAPNKWGIANPEVRLKTMDCIYFGRYWQEDTNGDGLANKRDEKTPIKWRIVNVSGNDAYAISDLCLDKRAYNERDSDVSWENCSLRKWLNEDFYNEAFNMNERDAIRSAASDDLGDSVYLATEDDILKYSSVFGSPKENIYMSGSGITTNYIYSSSIFDCGYTDYAKKIYGWWLMPSESDDTVKAAGCDGAVSPCYNKTDEDGVRPVLHINLSKNAHVEAEPVLLGMESSKWDCIYFGNYVQNEKDKKTPIKWRVLSVDGNDAFIMADCVLDEIEFKASDDSYFMWEKSALRKWLNEDFYNEAFSEAEKESIIETKIKYKYETAYPKSVKEKESTDKIYVPSSEEVLNTEYGFSPFDDVTNTRKAYYYAEYEYRARDWTVRDGIRNDMGVRSPIVSQDGDFMYNLNTDTEWVRPVCHIDLSKGTWKRAESMTATDYSCSDGVLERPDVTYSYADTVYFGNYGVPAYGGEKRPLQWRVLKRDGDDMFLMLEGSLCNRKYNDTDEDVTWETCDLRQWLNNDFYNEAFTEVEKQAIKYTVVINEDNPIYGTDGGNNTVDKVYLPSVQELMNEEYGFSTNIYADQRRFMGYSGLCYFTRTPGRTHTENASTYYGKVNTAYSDVSRYEEEVCPVIHVDTSLVMPEDAGRICTGVDSVTWDSIYFGNYWQEDTNGDGKANTSDKKTPIKWRVLSITGNDVYLISDSGLDYIDFDYDQADSGDGAILDWMNDYFYNEAFNSAEKEAIIPNNMNNRYEKVNVIPCMDLHKPLYGFAQEAYYESEARMCVGTDFAKAKGPYISDDDISKGNSQYWAYESIMSGDRFLLMTVAGAYLASFTYGDENGNSGGLIRPAIHIDMGSDTWKHAKKVSVSEYDRENEAPVPTLAPDYLQPSKKKPWSDDAHSYEIMPEPCGYGFSGPQYRAAIPYDVPKEAQIPDYYRWLEISYGYNKGVCGVILYDAYGAKYDLGPDVLEECGQVDVYKIIDLSSIRDFEDCLSKIEIYVTDQGVSDPNDPSFYDCCSIELDSIKLYTDKDYAPPVVTGTPTPTAPAATRTPPRTTSPVKTEPPQTAKTPQPTGQPQVPADSGITYVPWENVPGATPPADAAISATEEPASASPDEEDVGDISDSKISGSKKKLSVKPSFTVKKKKDAGIRYLQINLKKYKGDYIQVYIKAGKKPYKKASFNNIRIKKYNGVFKIQYEKQNQTLHIKVRTYKIKGKKKIYSRFSKPKKIIT